MSGVVLDNDGRAVIHNRETGQVLTCSVPTAIENVRISGGAWEHGPAPADAPVYEPKQAVTAPAIPLSEEGVLPMPTAEQAKALASMEQRAVAAEAEVKRLMAALDDAELAQKRSTPGGSAEKLEAIERETDEANGKLTAAQVKALDHDDDGKAGGSTPKAGRSPEEEAERAALFAEFKAMGVNVFAGSTTEKLREKMADLKAS